MTSSSLWQGLLDGRWSIVGRHDRGARHVLVARMNDATFAKVRALTGRERQVVELAASGNSNKQIAYAVGLSIGSVSGYLSSALRKMGLRSRAELVIVSPSSLSSKVAMASTLSDEPKCGGGHIRRGA